MRASLHDHLQDPHTIFLVPDRALSAFAVRVLKSWHVRKSKWPLPGVYSVSKVAQLLAASARPIRGIPPNYEIFAALLAKNADRNPLELLENFEAAEKYLKNSTDLKLWIKILEQEAENLSPKTIGAIHCLVQILTLSLENETPLQASQLFEELTDFDFDAANLAVLLGRPPTNASELKFFVVGHCDLLPSESRLIEQLGAKFEVQRNVNAVDVSEIPKWKNLRRASLQKDAQILWLSNDEIPGPIESTLLLEIPQIRSAVHSQLRYFDPAKKQMLEKDTAKHFDFEKYFETLSFTTFESSKKNFCEKMSKVTPRESFEIFQRLGMPNRTRMEREVPANDNPSAPLLLGLSDASLLEPAQTQIWGDEDEWTSLLQAPPRDIDELEKFFLAEGLAVPRVDMEHKQLLAALCNIAAEGSLLIAKEPSVPQFTEKTSVQIAPKTTQKISPSGLEQFYRCPLQFYFGREERFPMQEVFDDIDGNPVRRGTWLHAVFEELSFQNASELTLKEIEQLLVKKAVKSFEGAGSQTYLEVLLAQKKIIAENIFYYVQGIEVRLEKLFPHRKIQRELEVKIPWSSQLTLMGRVDRLDFTGEEFFLWDYKSGDFSKSTFSTAAKNGKFQWLLYAEIFEREGKPVVGGGYINPVQLSKSRLLFVERAKQLLGHDFFDQLDRLEIVYEAMKDHEFRELKKFVVDTTHSLAAKMLQKERRAAPVQPRECDICSYRGLCGYPYGISNERTGG